MADHKLRLRIASSFLLIVSFVLTFVFIITATGSTSESYGLTKITLDTADPESGVVTFTLGLLNVAVCSNKVSICATVSVDDEVVVAPLFDLVDQYDVAACPASAGKWVIAGQALILAFLLYPILSIIFNFQLRFKRIACLVPLVIAVGVAVSCVAVWAVNCIDDFNWDPCSGRATCPTLKAEISGAFGLEVATLALMIGGAICGVLYQIWPGDKSAADVPSPVEMASPSASALSISTDAPTSPSGSTAAYTNGFGY